MRTVPAQIHRADGTVEDVMAVEHNEEARHPLTGYPATVAVTELVDSATLASGDSITFTFEETE